MQITLENLSGLERKLNIAVPAENVESEINAKLHKLASKVKIPGFRPGKVPFEMVKKNYADSARIDVIENLIRDSYVAALKQKNLLPVGMPKIEIISSKPGEQFVYNATFEIYPEVKLADFKQIEVEKATSEVSDNDIGDMIEKMRKNQVQWQEVTDSARKSQAGDQITIDFTVTPRVPDKDIKPKTEENIKVVLGDGYMWTDFEQPLYGVSAGEEKKFVLQLPDTHMDKELAGNKSEFAVKVHKICEPILPDLDDNFVEKLNIKGGVEGLKSEVRSHMERGLQESLQELFKKAVMDKMLEHNPVDVPKTLVEKELDRLAYGWQKRSSSYLYGKTAEKAPEFPRGEFEQNAKRSVSLGLLMTEIVQKHQLKIDPQEIQEKIEDMVSAYYDDADEEAVNRMLSDANRVKEIEALLLEEKVVDYIASQMNKIEKAISYKDAVKGR